MNSTWNQLVESIESTPLHQQFKPTTYQIDWGKRKRGQGRRSGGMVLGAMSDAPTGVKIYLNLFGGVPEYKTHPEDFKILKNSEGIHYLKAREYGLNHNQAITYALFRCSYSNVLEEKKLQRIEFYKDNNNK